MRILCFLTLICSAAYGGKLPLLGDKMETKTQREAQHTGLGLEELKMKRRFGIGFSAGGPLALMGLDADFNLTPEVTVSMGYGTGFDYTTWMLKARYFLLGEWVSPYLGGGFARWWSRGTKDRRLAPALLTQDLLSEDNDPTKGFSAFLFYPCIGVQFMHRSGFDVFAELHYLFRLFTMANGTYAGVGMHWYF